MIKQAGEMCVWAAVVLWLFGEMGHRKPARPAIFKFIHTGEHFLKATAVCEKNKTQVWC